MISRHLLLFSVIQPVFCRGQTQYYLAHGGGYEVAWISLHTDLGLKDLGKRHPEQGLGAETARSGIKENEPELWKRLEQGELMETQAWMRRYKPKKNSVLSDH
jgi:hypothetical protein